MRKYNFFVSIRSEAVAEQNGCILEERNTLRKEGNNNKVIVFPLPHGECGGIFKGGQSPLLNCAVNRHNSISNTKKIAYTIFLVEHKKGCFLEKGQV